ncbi:CGNR zinc finger domain-containing protein [Streptomyces boninensis]|uniref:CGNR zinc finger domain-containing protein n=1 Tax=Streptomyces boninensis TaxID=2039455 RepID=UPI003B225884
MHFNHHGPAASAQYAAALVNSAATVDAYQAVIDAYATPSGTLVAERVPEVAAWAARLRAVFAEGELAPRVALVNELLAAAVRSPVVALHDGFAPHLHYADINDDLLTRMRARTASGLAHVLCDGDWRRPGQCAREGCGIVFMDTSRNGGRRFCTLRCANRVRTAEYRARLAAAD